MSISFVNKRTNVQILARLHALADPANKKFTMLVRKQLLKAHEVLLDISDDVDDAQHLLKKAKRRNRNVEQKEKALQVCGPMLVGHLLIFRLPLRMTTTMHRKSKRRHAATMHAIV